MTELKKLLADAKNKAANICINGFQRTDLGYFACFDLEFARLVDRQLNIKGDKK